MTPSNMNRYGHTSTVAESDDLRFSLNLEPYTFFYIAMIDPTVSV